MEIAENITWTEELERLDVLLSQGQFELLLPGERYGGGEKEIWLVYLMNDAAESFLVFHDAELTGTYQKEYEGEIDAALEKDGEQYVLIVRQGETVCTLFFSRLSLEVHLFDYGKTGHFWVDGYEYLRQIEFRIAILRDKLEYLGEAFCTESVSSIRSIKVPSSCFAIRYAYRAVRRFPTCIRPVGLGANLVFTLLIFLFS